MTTNPDLLRRALTRIDQIGSRQTGAAIRNHIGVLNAELAEARQVIADFKAAHGLNGWDHAALFLAMCRANGGQMEHEMPALMAGGVE